MNDDREDRHGEFARRAPILSVLSDLPLATDQTWRDSFELAQRVGPVYDILRHPKTRTPLAIAVYGDWGTGKTTAMRWLDGLLDEWNRSGAGGKERVKVRPVWFYPWKYHSKREVWRGLVAEVILASIDARKATVARVTQAARQFGLFLGRSFLHVLAGIKLKAPGGAAEVDLASIKDVLAEYREAAHPETAYLNDFEESLRSWINETIGPQERMVVFIDDLDRCMPEVALQVLEALKLYLNIEKLIFVVGVDRAVVDELVRKHYEQLGLAPEKSRHYLAKMFQVEVQVAVSEPRIETFLDEQLGDLDLWQELSADEQGIFHDRILRLAGRNPREVKRLANSAVMLGAGALMAAQAHPEQAGPALTLAQGLQLFFVHRILHERYPSLDFLVGARIGDRFFGDWSRIVREHPQADIPRHMTVPEAFLEAAPGPGEERRRADARERIEMIAEGLRAEGPESAAQAADLSFAHPAYHDLLREFRRSGLLRLLADRDLGELMRIEYPVETAAYRAAVAGPAAEDPVRRAIARAAGKEPDEEVSEDDYARVKKLDLTGQEVTDLSSLAGLAKLESLHLGGTQVADLGPLKGLAEVRYLSLDGTQVAHLGPLKGLGNLKRLDLDGTQVADLGPLAGLTNLRQLYLDGTQVADLGPLARLANLEELALASTHVGDLSPLAGLAELRWLSLAGTQVADLDPLKNLVNLERLDVAGTRVADLGPLKGLKKLEVLLASRTPELEGHVAALERRLPGFAVGWVD